MRRRRAGRRDALFLGGSRFRHCLESSRR
jgi:hypothetical protein